MNKRIPYEKSLAYLRPDLTREWHITKNGELKPDDVLPTSGKTVWWCLPYDDSETGKHFDFEWRARILHRNNGIGCPYLSNQAVWKGYNDLTTTNPDLASEWHPTRNGELKPDDVVSGSNKRVWWYLPYNDPKTGKHFDFEWQASISSRTRGLECPYLSNQAVWPGFNDLGTKRPDLAEQWHPIKNGDLTPMDVTCGSSKKVWWYYPYNDPGTGKHFDFEWQAIIKHRNNDSGCPFLVRFNTRAWPGYNDLCTLNPGIAAEWHPTKNGRLRPENVTCNNGRKVWWFLPYDDPITGKHFDFEWQDTISHRVSGRGCPFLSGHAVWKGFNDLESVNPILAAEWHPTKNGKLKPDNVTCGNNSSIWWYLPYDDPMSGKHFDFEWQETIANRMKSYGCPFLSGRSVWKGYNDLTTTNPDLAAEWHPTKNGSLLPSDVINNSGRMVWWYLHYDDPITKKKFDFEWQATVNHRSNGTGCPFISGKSVWIGFNDLVTTNPELAKEWHPTRNGLLEPTDFTKGSLKKVWWYLPYDDPKTNEHFDFEWQATIYNRSHGDGCPYLAESYGEQYVRKYLIRNHIKFVYEKTFSDLSGIGGSALSYDFYIKETNYLIEYQGRQHYEPVDYFGGDEQFIIQKEHDRRKRQYAKNKGLHLIEIHYKYNTFEKVKDYLDKYFLPLISLNGFT